MYRYPFVDQPLEWLTLIAPGCDLDEARATLIWRFGADRLFDVLEHGEKRPLKAMPLKVTESDLDYLVPGRFRSGPRYLRSGPTLYTLAVVHT